MFCFLCSSWDLTYGFWKIHSKVNNPSSFFFFLNLEIYFYTASPLSLSHAVSCPALNYSFGEQKMVWGAIWFSHLITAWHMLRPMKDCKGIAKVSARDISFEEVDVEFQAHVIQCCAPAGQTFWKSMFRKWCFICDEILWTGFLLLLFQHHVWHAPYEKYFPQLRPFFCI